MARNIMNPWTNRSIDYDSIPLFSAERQQPGRFCPTTGNPMDDEALKHWHPMLANEGSNNSLLDQAKKNVAKINADLAAD